MSRTSKPHLRMTACQLVDLRGCMSSGTPVLGLLPIQPDGPRSSQAVDHLDFHRLHGLLRYDRLGVKLDGCMSPQDLQCPRLPSFANVAISFLTLLKCAAVDRYRLPFVLFA